MDIINFVDDIFDVPIRVEFICRKCKLIYWLETHIPECCETPKIIKKGRYKMSVFDEISTINLGR